MRKSTPKKAKQGSAGYRKNWTKTWDANVHYRHNADGSLSFATRTHNRGTRHYLKLRATSFEGARREAVGTQDEAVYLPKARSIPTVEQYWRERVIPAIRRGDQRPRSIWGYLQNAQQILRGNETEKGRRKRNEAGNLSKSGDGACPRQILRMRVDQITAEDCAEWFQNAFLNPYSLSAVKSQWIQWRVFFQLAIKDGYLIKAPAYGINTKKARGRENAFRVNVLGQPRRLEVLDRQQLLNVIEDIRKNGQKLDGRADDVANVNLLLATTGLRMCELRALRWRDVDFESKVMTVEGRLKSNRKAVDYIHLNKWAISALLRLKAGGYTRERKPDQNGRERAYRVFRGDVVEELNKHDRVILKKVNPCLRPGDFVSSFESVERAFQNACIRLGYEPQSPHKLRHFFATECAEQGDSWAVIAQHLGHSDGGALAAKTYSHVRRGHAAERADQWDLAPGEDAKLVKIAS